ncbi:hypothetical protein [Streptococcus hyovaginalis]|uniref:hypothetical protein n=1 Tax=Streptococcus hyovaginalis TaxID=149015 RepID=UPI0020167209|nr:hypothetical protein [Streptococcus hyovaginalis]
MGLYFVGQAYFERGFEGVQIVEQEVAPHLAAKAWSGLRVSGYQDESTQSQLPQGTFREF